MENEKWGFDLHTDHEQVEAEKYFWMIRYTLYLIVLIVIKPKFIMSRKDYFHIDVIDIVKLCIITALLSLCTEFAPKLLKKCHYYS